MRRGRIPGRIDEAAHVLVSVEALRPALELDAAMPCYPVSQPDVDLDEVLDETQAHRSAERSA